MMMQKSGCPYVTNGLVFWLDGINKGSDDGSWVDLINGYSFANHNATSLEDGFSLNGSSSYLICNDELIHDCRTSTIECVFLLKENNQFSTFFLEKSGEYALEFIPSTYATGILFCNGNFSGNKYLNTSLVTNRKYTASIDFESGMLNGSEGQFGNRADTARSAVAGTCVGAQQYQTGSFVRYANGEIYCIRIYDRHLSAEEKLYNQIIDKERFGVSF